MKLEDKIKDWIDRHPDRIYAGRQMLEQLHIINTEMKGPERDNLLFILDETVERQDEIDATNHAAMMYMEELNFGVSELISTTVDCIAIAQKKPRKIHGVIPDIPTLIDKALN